MKQITFYFDFVSPYAWLAFEQLPVALEGLSYSVDYRPVLFGAVLQHHGNASPVSVVPKRNWIYRHASWLGHSLGVPLQMPARHPFNPLPLLRQALACSHDGSINRFVARSMFEHVWVGGHDALDAARLDALAQTLAPQLKHDGEPGSAAVKTMLRSNTDQALAHGVFGVPAFCVDDKLFWGLDSLPMLRAWLQGDAWFEQEWAAATQVDNGLAPSGA